MGRAEFTAGADGAGERRGPVAAMIFLCTCVCCAAPPHAAPHAPAWLRASLQPRPRRVQRPRLARALTFRLAWRRNETLGENLERKLSGLTRSSLRDVEALAPGSPVYLFNVNDKRMHGVFESVRRAARRR